MTNLTTITWLRFGVWLVLGFIIYFTYSRRNSLVGQGLQDESVEELGGATG